MAEVSHLAPPPPPAISPLLSGRFPPKGGGGGTVMKSPTTGELHHKSIPQYHNRLHLVKIFFGAFGA